MPKSRVSIPSYCHHKPKDLAYVQLCGHYIYLGKYDSPESKAEYQRVVGEWLARGRTYVPHPSADGPSVNEVLLAFWRFAESFYINPDGTPSLEQDKLAQATLPLKQLYGTTPSSQFGPVALKAVRQKMIDGKLARTTVNQRISCIKRIFRWAVGEELIPPSIYHGLQAVSGLKRGRSGARETEPVRPVPDAHVDAVLPFLCPTVKAMVQVQRHTGMRSAELCQIRPCDIETDGETWVFRPPHHKTAHLGQSRIVRIGPKARQYLEPLLPSDLTAYIFSPRRARAERYAEKRAKRKSKVQPSQISRAKRRPKRAPGEKYTTGSYYSAVLYGIEQAIKAAALPEGTRWHPHQLRHNHATAVRRQFGLDAARAVLGQRSLSIADTYAELDAGLATKVAREIG